MMNKQNMERGINNWVLCRSKSFPGKFYYFNVLTGEAAWSLAEIENARSMPKNSYLQKVDKWHTYPEPDSPPDDQFYEPTWRRRPDQYVFGRPTVPSVGPPAFPMYGPQYMEPQMPSLMQNPTPMGSVFMGVSRQKDIQNMWGYDRDSYFRNLDKSKMFIQCEKPQGNLLNTNFNTSTPMKSHWSSYDYQKNGAIPIFGQNLPKKTPRICEPVFAQKQGNPPLNPKNLFQLPEKPKTVIKEPMLRRIRTLSDSLNTDYDDNLFTTKSIENLRSLDDSAFFERPSQRNITNFTQKSPVFQAGRVFGTKSYENLPSFNDSGCFEMPKPKSAIQKNLFLTPQDRNIRFTKQISKSSENVSSTDNLKSISSHKAPQSVQIGQERNTAQSVLSGQDTVVGKRKIDGGRVEGEQDALDELGQNDLRFILMAKRKRIENPQGGTGTKIKTRYSEKNKVQTPKKRVTFDIDFQSDDEVPEDEVPQEHPQEDEIYGDEAAYEEDPLDIKTLRSLAKPQTKTDAWYIVVDMEVLLEDFEFIETFVQTDSKCRLLIPMAVRLEIDALCVGDCRGRARVIAARHLARRVNDQPHHITVQVAEDYDSETSTSESIINCCLQAIDQKYHVVLITNDATLHEKANSNGIPWFTLQEIKDGASTPKPELSFNIKKIVHLDTVNGGKNQNVAVSSGANPFSLDSRNKIPVNCFRQRLFDDQTTENNHDDALFFNDDEVNMIDDPFLIPKPNQMLKRSVDCQNFQQSNFIPPKDYRDNKDISDSSANTSEIRQIQENIQNLVIKDTARNIIVHKEGRVTKPENVKEKPMLAEENVKYFHKEEAKVFGPTTKKMKLKSINGYTIEQHLKEFDIKTKLVEDRVKTRMDEWICSYSQIMEDILTYILQDYIGTQSTLRPPWSLPEAVQCVRDMYGDHSSVKTIVDRLAALLFNCSCKKGILRLNMKPKDFMTIFGLGILLIQCLKSVLPSSCELAKAEEALLSLLQLVTEPGSDPAPPAPAPAPLCNTSADTADRKNFVKKPSEVIEYLKKHYPEWESYKETTEEEDLQRKMDQLKEKGKQMQKIVRTFGKDLHNLKIDNKKGLSMTKPNDSKTSAKNDEHSDTKDIKAKKLKVNADSLDDIETTSACDKAIKSTGAKLLRKLAVNSLHKLPTLKNIDVEKREQTGIELTNMIENMVGNGNTDVAETKITDDNDKNNNTNEAINENRAAADKEPKFVRKFGNFTIKKINFQSDGDKNKSTLVNEAPKDMNETKRKSPKIIRNFNLPNPVKDKTVKTEEKLDLDALDYDMDMDDSHDDTSQITIVDFNNDENHDDAGNQNDDNNKQTDDESPKNDHRSGDERNNENVETDTTNDSGFENDSLHAYTLARTCLTEISETFMAIYSFVSSAELKFREGHISEGTRREMHRTAGETRKLLAGLIANLKSIKERESNDRTSMRTVLIKARVEAFNDKRIIKYRQVISKYLEQASILQEGLATVLAATGAGVGAPDDAATASSLSSTIKYINIFE